LPILDRGGFFTLNHPISHACVAARIPASMAPDGMFISNDEPSFSVRTQTDAKGLIAIANGPSFKTGQGDPDLTCRQTVDWVQRYFNTERIEYRWVNEDYVSVDMLPFVGKLTASTDHIWVATGLNAWGMTAGTMAALILTDLILGNENLWAGIYDSTRVRPLASAVEFAKENLNVGKEWLKDHLVPAPKQAFEDLVPGQGAIIRTDNGTVAAYRDNKGHVHAVSPTCTHLGCTVVWNPVGGTWDCPCHGSRFDIMGRVLYGPAIRDLKKVSISE
jgi:nitrite reductase/ring-hydroxylating ferredoxin subunit